MGSGDAVNTMSICSSYVNHLFVCIFWISRATAGHWHEEAKQCYYLQPKVVLLQGWLVHMTAAIIRQGISMFLWALALGAPLQVENKTPIAPKMDPRGPLPPAISVWYPIGMFVLENPLGSTQPKRPETM